MSTVKLGKPGSILMIVGGFVATGLCLAGVFLISFFLVPLFYEGEDATALSGYTDALMIIVGIAVGFGATLGILGSVVANGIFKSSIPLKKIKTIGIIGLVLAIAMNGAIIGSLIYGTILTIIESLPLFVILSASIHSLVLSLFGLTMLGSIFLIVHANKPE